MRLILTDKRLISWLRSAGYITIIISIIVFAVWAYVRHRGAEKPEPKPLIKKERPPLVVATWESRFTFADEREFFAPPAFPWSMSSIGQPPFAEITYVTVISEPSPEELAEPSDNNTPEDGKTPALEDETLPRSKPPTRTAYADIIANAMLTRAPYLAIPYEIKATPPYLVVPLEFTMNLTLGPDGAVKSVTVQGDMEENLRVQIAEKAVDLRFPSVLAWFGFRCGIRLTPRHYDKIVGIRGGARLPEDEYRLLVRGLQYGTSGLAEVITENAPELLTVGSDYTIEFLID
ncbi:MAG: hypothetical protein JSW52_02005, partial [Candidatus Coatesbacteria bacterium]